MRCGRFFLAVGLAFAVSGAALAQEKGDDAAEIQRGYEIANRICWACHVIGPRQDYTPALREPAPDFRLIARNRGNSPESLKVFIRTTHDESNRAYTMPNPRLNNEMVDAVVAYIMSLRTSQ